MDTSPLPASIFLTSKCFRLKSHLFIFEFYTVLITHFKRGSYDAITGQSLNYASIPLCEAIPFHYPAPSALAAAKLNQLVGSWPKSQEVIRLPKPSRPNGLFPKKGEEIDRVRWTGFVAAQTYQICTDWKLIYTNMVCRLKSCRPDAAIFRLLVGIWRSWRIASSFQAGAASMVFVRCLSLFIFSLIVCLCNILSIGKDGQETSWSPQRSTWPARRRDPLLASLEPHTDRQLAAKEEDSIEKLIPSDFGQVVKQWIGGAAPSRKYSNIEKV